MNINQNYREAVKAIKEAILRSQYRAAASVNKEQLSLYYGIGRYVSENSRTGFWGKGAIEQISSLLQKELPGLRGFSATVRIFLTRPPYFFVYSSRPLSAGAFAFCSSTASARPMAIPAIP